MVYHRKLALLCIYVAIMHQTDVKSFQFTQQWPHNRQSPHSRRDRRVTTTRNPAGRVSKNSRIRLYDSENSNPSGNVTAVGGIGGAPSAGVSFIPTSTTSTSTSLQSSANSDDVMQKTTNPYKTYYKNLYVNNDTDIDIADSDIDIWTNHMTSPPPPEALLSDTSTICHQLSNLLPSDTINLKKYWSTLTPHLEHLNSTSLDLTKSALKLAYVAHQSQYRKSGEPYIIHPVAVTQILGELKMDAESVVAGLLHDTVEDTDVTFQYIEENFGETVRNIVEGETKVSKLPKLTLSAASDSQAENLRQMFVAMTSDYRIIIVKLADRLHNMRTLGSMSKEKKQRISRETLDIFAPLAHRMGIWEIKSELEDTAFFYLYPLEYKRLNRKLRKNQSKHRDTLQSSRNILESSLAEDPMLEAQKVEFSVTGRMKELYSLWLKMETKYEHDLSRITDVVALRVVIDPEIKEGETEQEHQQRSVWLCYHVLGLVQHLPNCQPIPTSVKDYISFPKPNGYQSLHTAIRHKDQTVEVQIRTKRMHRVAEKGMASHWAYKDKYGVEWLNSIREWEGEGVSSRDFVESVRRELLGKRVFVFLRNGKILNLARGATAIDAAFQIHTEVGLYMHGVEINGKDVPFMYELQNGDVVNILTGEGKPALDWMRYSKARSTRAKLRSYFRSKQRDSLAEAGSIMLTDFLTVHRGLILKETHLDSTRIPNTAEGFGDFLPGNSRYHSVEEFCIEIGKTHNRQLLRTVVGKLLKVNISVLNEAEESGGKTSKEAKGNYAKAIAKAVRYAGGEVEDADAEEEPDKTMVVSRLEKGAVDDSSNATFGSMAMEILYADPDHLCPSCLPVRGDDIIGTKPRSGLPHTDAGFVTTHRRGCPLAQRALEQSLRKYSETTPSPSPTQPPGSDIEGVPLIWNPYKDEEDSFVLYPTVIHIYALDRKLLLSECSEVVSDNANIVKTGSLTTNEHADFEFRVEVRDLAQVQKLMDEIMNIRSIMSVERRMGTGPMGEDGNQGGMFDTH
ncbi:hypothetical protein TrST_g9155 [Triparma strigata]|uniref:Putative GTP diphosphokinase RSH1, chloroplastic n=1 Tax=Triparma strigata TaxID=1606541 RepID=A0A9W7BZM9_9STRA|nr:hypothetical protein TrST_g9155 [Triparma strigata]